MTDTYERKTRGRAIAGMSMGLCVIAALPALAGAGVAVDLGHFGAEAWVQLDHNDSIDVTEELTAAGWVYRRDWEGEDSWLQLWGKGNDSWILRRRRTDEYMDVTHRPAGQEDTEDAGWQWPAGEWVHLAHTFSSSEGVSRAYANGELVLEYTHDPGETLASVEDPLALGARHYEGELSRFFGGMIRDFRLWDRALSQDEIQQVMDEQDVPEGLVVHWKLDEGEGDVANDASGMGNHGTLEGAVEWVRTTPPDSPLPSVDREASVFEVIEWSLENPDWGGNPFDLEASATFTHAETDRVITTGMFYDGGSTWRFRFTPTRPGTWTFETDSSHDALHGHAGTVEVEADPQALGFLTAKGNKFARQVGDERDLRAAMFNVYTHWCLTGRLGEYPYPYNKYLADWEEHPDGVRGEARDRARETREHGMDVLKIQCVANQAFSAGVRSHQEHDSVNPDLETFRILDEILQTTHEEGVAVHFWWWGDEDRRWTPMGVPSGINGEADRRLQRYIAARLAPLPGWAMSYGFDLHETNWTGSRPDLVRDWHDYLHEHWGWEHLLIARESQNLSRGDDYWFRTPDEMPVYSVDDSPESGWEFYQVARARLEGEPKVARQDPEARLRPRPVLLERRFLHTRDDVWDGRTTRRAMWQFALAGGAGSVWGRKWGEDSPPYDAETREQLRCFARFWRNRWQLNLTAVSELVGGEETAALAAEDGTLVIAYAQDAESVQIDLSGADQTLSAVAVDTTAAYEEVNLGAFDPGEHEIELPFRTDWALAFLTADD